MPRKIQIIEIIEYVYEPKLGDDEYSSNNVETIEQALELDRKGIESGDIGSVDLADDYVVVGRKFRIIDEP